jgi:hypothetical protein
VSLVEIPHGQMIARLRDLAASSPDVEASAVVSVDD